VCPPISWFQPDPIYGQIFRSEYHNGSWMNPNNIADNISPDGGDADYPNVAVDNDGNALIVWRQSDGSNTQVFVSEYR
jgi:hypothetical protein